MGIDHHGQPTVFGRQPGDSVIKLSLGFEPEHGDLFDRRPLAAQEIPMTKPVFRFAPSPNGALHLGHAYSALLNFRMAQDIGGRFLVRMEDTDRGRCHPRFMEQMLEDLAWLGLRWEQPVRVQSEHLPDYYANIRKLWDMRAAYPCFCTRRTMVPDRLGRRDPDGQPLYGGACRALNASAAMARIEAGAVHAWRIDMGACRDEDAAIWGDAAIARLMNGSSYHIAVVTDDHLQGVTHVVRGRDIEAATPLHRLLQRLLGFRSPLYYHHALILDEQGRKLSKSDRSRSLADLRSAGIAAAEIRRRLGFA